MNRTRMGWLALLLLAASLGIAVFARSDENDQILAALLRIGAILAALWLALPELKQLSSWAWILTLALVVVLAVRPKFFLIAFVLALVTAVLRARWIRPA